jgi:protein-tyrosine phosphatase
MKKMVAEEEDEDAACSQASIWTPDFHWLTEHLAVGSSFPAERVFELANAHGIGAVIDLRQEDCDDEVSLAAAGIQFLHLPTPDLEPASPEMLEQGVQFAREQVANDKKVLVHCQHGIGRSALLSLCVLVDGGWEPMEALSHAKNVRAVVSPSQSQFEGWAKWLRGRGKTAPDYHTFGCVAYRHLANGH